jgi:hypothetical protein
VSSSRVVKPPHRANLTSTSVKRFDCTEHGVKHQKDSSRLKTSSMRQQHQLDGCPDARQRREYGRATLEKRLALYVRLRLEDDPTLTAPKEEVQRLVCALYRRADAEFRDDEHRLRNWLELSPYENVVKANHEHFIKKLHQILIKVKTSQRWSLGKKGVRAFSLLPFSSSFAAAHIVINGSTLYGFRARMSEESCANPHDRKNPLGIALSKTGQHLISMSEVCANKELYLRRAFSVSKFETVAPGATITKQQFDAMDYRSKVPIASRLFANQVMMDSYSASVLVTRPKLEHEQKQEMSKPSKKPRWGKHSTSDDDEWCALPLDYEADMVIRIDFGMRRLCTAVREGDVMLPHGLLKERIRKKRSRRKRRKRRRKRRRRDRAQGVRMRRVDPGARQAGCQVIQVVRTREYQHLAGFNKWRYWYEHLKLQEDEYCRVLKGIPSFKTARFETYLARLKNFWRHVDYLITFCAGKAFLKWRFFCKRIN